MSGGAAASTRLREASAALRRVYRASLGEARALDRVPVLQCLVDDGEWASLLPALSAGVGGASVPARAYQSPWTMTEHVRGSWRARTVGEAPPGAVLGPDAAVKGLAAMRDARILAQRLGALPWRGVASEHDVFDAYVRAKRAGALEDPAKAPRHEGGHVLEGLVARGDEASAADAVLLRAIGEETDAAKAVQMLKESVKSGETAVARFMLGFAALEAGQFGEAVNELRRAIALDPGLGSAWHELGMAVLKAPLGDGEESGARADEAARCFRHARASPRMVRGERKRPTLMVLELLASASQAPGHVDDHAQVAREILWLLLAAAEEDPADVEYLRNALLRRCEKLASGGGG